MNATQGSLFDAGPVQASIPGLVYQPEFLSVDEEQVLLDIIASLPLQAARYKEYLARRRVVSFGGSYDFDTNRLLPAAALDARLKPLRAQVAAWIGVTPEALVHALVAEYAPGAPWAGTAMYRTSRASWVCRSAGQRRCGSGPTPTSRACSARSCGCRSLRGRSTAWKTKPDGDGSTAWSQPRNCGGLSLSGRRFSSLIPLPTMLSVPSVPSLDLQGGVEQFDACSLHLIQGPGGWSASPHRPSAAFRQVTTAPKKRPAIQSVKAIRTPAGRRLTYTNRRTEDAASVC